MLSGQEWGLGQWSAGTRSACLHVAGVGAVLAGVAGVEWARRRLLEERPPGPDPAGWRKVGELDELFCYPLKSGIPVLEHTLEASDLGLRKGSLRDRVLLVVDRSGRQVTQRTHGRLALIRPTVDGDTMTLAGPDESAGPLTLKIPELLQNPRTKVSVWGETASAVDCGDAAAAWIRRTVVDPDAHKEASVEADLRLVFYPEDVSTRPGRKGDNGAYQDQTTYHLVTEASLTDLNGRLSEPVTVRNFRPNFFIRGEVQPYEEDSWKWIRIGDKAIFRNLMPCTRCLLTTVNPETGIKSSSTDPLKTLRSYRSPTAEEKLRIGTSPKFGVRLGIYQTGPVSLGDPVYVPATA